MQSQVRFRSVDFSRASYQPGEPVEWQAVLHNHSGRPVPARLAATIRRLDQVLDTLEQELILEAGEHSLAFTWNPPAQAPRGYGLDLQVVADAGLLASFSTAFDVLESWTQFPRYGFLTDFSPDRVDGDQTLQLLARYHLNGLQFYDWMYRHDRFLTAQEPYPDPLGRWLSRRTVDALIEAAHRRGMAAMPYTAVYGASLEFYREHPDWVLCGADGKPVFFYDFLAIMDPRPGSPWTQHLLGQFDEICAQTTFDGIHLDQYGEPRVGYDQRGQSFDLAAPLADLINRTKACVRGHRPEGAVVFNAVANWPVADVAQTEQDFIYIEVWPPDTRLTDLHRLVVDAQALSPAEGKPGKAVVLAVYLDPANEPLVRLVDAVIFASGGSHIELGERSEDGSAAVPGLLADPYFPKYRPLSTGLAEVIRRQYDFAVRYQEVTGPGTRDTTPDVRLLVEGVPSLDPGGIWPLVRRGESGLGINLINLCGLQNLEWTQPQVDPPVPVGPVNVRVEGLDREVAVVWLASPDGEDLSPQELEFTQAYGALSFTLPSLVYWDLIVFRWKGQTLPD